MIKLYSGWGTGPTGEYLDFNNVAIRGLQKFGSADHEYYHFEYFDNGWQSVESLECPEVTSMDLTAQVQSDESLLDKVMKEVDAMYEDGLPEIDIKQAVLKKYGEQVFNEVFGE